jgi:uncharacterized membrane protein (UPF0136 family)
VVVGFILMVVGAAGYQLTGSTHPTALIPALIGLLLAIAGILARKESRRGLWMHVAVTLGLLGFLGTITSIVSVAKMAMGTVPEHPIAVEEKFASCVICLIFVAACVRSFIAARKARTVAAV